MHDARLREPLSITARQLTGLVLGVSVALYVAACALPALSSSAYPPSEERDNAWSGFALLIFGWFEVAYLRFAWLSNLLVALGWIQLIVCLCGGGRRSDLRVVMLCGVLALVLSLDTFRDARDASSQNIDEPGRVTVDYFEGAYAWWASQVSIALGGFLVAREEDRRVRQHLPTA